MGGHDPPGATTFERHALDEFTGPLLHDVHDLPVHMLHTEPLRALPGGLEESPRVHVEGVHSESELVLGVEPEVLHPGDARVLTRGGHGSWSGRAVGCLRGS
jgi:hypothetical protein